MHNYTQNLVSIITPNYNCAASIARTIESVIAQTYKEWEMLIVDDCSTDGSYEIALDYAAKDSRIKVLRNEKNSGAAVSRNKALDLAQGEFIAFLDSDDLWEPEKLEKQIAFMRENKCDFCYSRYDLIDEDNLPIGKIARIPKKLSYWKLLHHDYIGCLTAVYRSDFAKDLRSFNIKNNNDYGLFLQVVKKAKNAMGLKEILAHYRIRKSGISRKKFKKVKPYFELMHNYLHYPYIICCWFLFTNILIGKVYKYEKNSLH